MAKKQTIHQDIASTCELAKTYAEDGAFYTASAILIELGEKLKRHADACAVPAVKT